MQGEAESNLAKKIISMDGRRVYGIYSEKKNTTRSYKERIFLKTNVANVVKHIEENFSQKCITGCYIRFLILKDNVVNFEEIPFTRGVMLY